MRMYDLIQKKRNGGELSTEEISWIIAEFSAGDVPDYQMSALLMAIYYVGMTSRETLALTQAIIDTGETIDTSIFGPHVVDKHSTGGVGDTTSLILGPLVASAGAVIPKMSGRGLGHTGGTLDKLESFPGLNIELPVNAFIETVKKVGVAIVSQTRDLAPADKKLYSLRDATATVDSVPLIASSIMSKKIASGSPAMVLDVKVGKGAFMPTLATARDLAETMISIGKGFGRNVSVVLSAMDDPLGHTVGNVLEVKEAISVLNGNGPQDLTELCIALGAEMLVLSQVEENVASARDTLQRILASGQGVIKLAEMVNAQGGDERYVYEPDRFPRAKYVQKVRSEKSGYVLNIDALAVGTAAMKLGAGRAFKEDAVDLTAGILLSCERGSWVNAGDVIAEIHTDKRERIQDAISAVLEAIVLGKEAPQEKSLILDIIR